MRKILLALAIILMLFVSSTPLSINIAKAPPALSDSRGIWRLDEGTGTTAYDSSGNLNHGTLNDTCTWTTGKHNTAISFDGTYDMIEIPDSNSLDIVGKITIEAWINLRNTTPGGSVIAMKYNHTSLSSSYYLGLGGGGKVIFGLSYNGNNYYQVLSTTTITLNTWTHVAAVMNSTHMLIYINGVLDGNLAYPPGTIFAGTANLRIGCYLPEAGYPRYFNGTIDEVKIFNYARTPPFTLWRVDDDRVECPTADFTTVQEAINAAAPNDQILVYDGTYSEALYIERSLVIKAASTPVITGSQMFATEYGNRESVIFVKNAANVILEGFDIEGLGLGPAPTRNYGVLYQNSSGTVRDCIISPNTIGDMGSVGIAAISKSDLTVERCTIRNFGRIGVYATNVANIVISNNEIIGQTYAADNLVNYGIEIEDYDGPSVADIRFNTIYNCNNTHPSPLWSSCAIIVDTWREWADLYGFTLLPSNVSITRNIIYNNYEAIEIVSNDFSYAHYNCFFNNAWGVWSAPENWTTNPTYYWFDARYNWWGDTTGPYNPARNPTGLGDEASDYVLFEPWLVTTFDYHRENPVVNEIVTFDASLTTMPCMAKHVIEAYIWNFGDGSLKVATNPVVTHSYATPGSKNATLTLRYDDDSTFTTWAIIYVAKEPWLKLVPDQVVGKHLGDTFSANVTIADLDVSQRMIGLEFRIQFNSTLLSVDNVEAGAFMLDPEWNKNTVFLTYNIFGDELVIGLMLFPNGTGQWEAFPHGGGTVAVITFEIAYQERGTDKDPLSSCLRLFNTRLVDDKGQLLPHSSEFTVKINVEDLLISEEFVGCEFHIAFDTAKLDIVAASAGEFILDPEWNKYGVYVFCHEHEGHNEAVVGLLLAPNASGQWEAFPYGSGTLVELTFRRHYSLLPYEAPFSCTFALFNVKMINNVGEFFAHPLESIYQYTHYSVIPTHLADVNFDGYVGIDDIFIIANAFGAEPGHPRWNPLLDLNNDDYIGIDDIWFAANNFGWEIDC